jgi:hypothetical protein
MAARGRGAVLADCAGVRGHRTCRLCCATHVESACSSRERERSRCLHSMPGLVPNPRTASTIGSLDTAFIVQR